MMSDISCEYCNDNSSDCRIFEDPLDGQWYLEIQTSEWNDYDDDFVYIREYINYCPYCSRKLGVDE